MFITDALKEKVNQSLCAIEVRSAWFERLKETPEWWADTTTCWATERALHVAIECVVDAANALIDALVMRDPGGIWTSCASSPRSKSCRSRGLRRSVA
ncbi:hypothetical protein GCM10025857_07820 [Alicyclobacillus contaminans]|nr:hypothetical protein GCM10025857_07820 [Alicyclobacillus contaminans]